MKKLFNLDAAEVSLVDKGANKKKFLIFKSRKGKPMPAKISEAVREVMSMPSDVASRMEKVVKAMGCEKAEGDMPPKKDSHVFKGPEHEKPLSDRAQAALKAVGRILHPHKDEIHAGHVGAVAHEVGLADHSDPQRGEVEQAEGEDKRPMEHEDHDEIEMSKAIPEDVEEEHHVEAIGMAKKAYKAHLEKMGYRKYPDEQPAQKAKAGMNDEEEEDEEEEGQMKKSKVAKSVDLSAFPKGQRGQLEAIFKSNQELIRKNEALEEQLKAREEREKDREIIAKAESFRFVGLATEDIADSLRDAAKVGPKSFERICKQFEALNEQGRTADLFSVKGTAATHAVGNAEAKLEALVDSVVQKSGGAKSREEIYDEVCQTPEGKRLYRESQQKRFQVGGR